MELQTTIEEILESKEPVTTVENLIVGQGGFWNQIEATNSKKAIHNKTLWSAW